MAALQKRIESAYEPDELKYAPLDVVSALHLEREDAKLLCEIGVPSIGEWNVEFKFIDSFPLLQDAVPWTRDFPDDWPQYLRCFDVEDDFAMGLNVRSGGNVVCVELSRGNGSSLFINSRLRYMVGFFAECRLHLKRVRDGEMDCDESFAISLDWMRELDSPAVKSGWWQGVFETINLYQ